MSAGNFGSAIGVTAQISLRRDQIAADAQAARAELTAAFQSMEIPLGAKLIESVTAAAPNITTIIAEAIAAGASRGMQLVPGGGMIPGIPEGGGGGSGGYDFGSEAWKDDYNQRLVRQQVTAAYRRNQLGNVGGQQPEIAETMEEIGITEMGMMQGEELRQRALWHAKQMARAESDAAVESPSGGPEYGPGNYVQESMAVGDELRTRSMWHADSMADREARLGALNQRMGRSEDLSEAGLRPQFGSSDPYAAEEGAAAGGAAGAAGMGTLFAGFLAFRGVKAIASHMDRESDLELEEADTEALPTRTLKQQLKKAEQEKSEAKRQVDEYSGPIGWVEKSFSGGGSGDFWSYNHMFGNAMDDRLNANFDSADTNVRQIQSSQDLKEREQDSRKEELETKIYEARKRGNEADADHLELLNKIEQKQREMNDKDPGSGDRFRNGLGAEMLGDQSTRSTAASAMQEVQNQQSLVDIQGASHEMSERANGAHTRADRDRFSRQLDDRLTAAAVARDKVLNDPNSSEQQKNDAQSTFDAVSAATISDQSSYDQSIAKEQKQQVDDVNEHTKEMNMGGGYAAERSHISYEYNKQIKAAREDGNHDLVDALEKEKDSALRHMGGGPTFTSGIETWKKMQRAGYGSDRGTDSGAQRTYASHGGGGGGGAAGGMINSGNPNIHSSNPLGQIHSSLPSVNWGSPIQAGGSWATHPIGAGLGFAGFHPSANRAYGDHVAAIQDSAAKQSQGGNHPHNGGPAAHDDVSKSLMDAAKNLNAATQKKMVIVSGVV